MITNEILFYGGMIFTGLTVISAIVTYFIFKIKFERLNNQLNIEYGEKEKEIL